MMREYRYIQTVLMPAERCPLCDVLVFRDGPLMRCAFCESIINRFGEVHERVHEVLDQTRVESPSCG